MTINNYPQKLTERGYKIYDGEIEYRKDFGLKSAYITIVPETKTYILMIYDYAFETEYCRKYSSLLTLELALKLRKLI